MSVGVDDMFGLIKVFSFLLDNAKHRLLIPCTL